MTSITTFTWCKRGIRFNVAIQFESATQRLTLFCCSQRFFPDFDGKRSIKIKYNSIADMASLATMPITNPHFRDTSILQVAQLCGLAQGNGNSACH